MTILEPLNREARVVNAIRSDPVGWIEQTFGEQVIGKQVDICEAIRDYDEVDVRSCHDSGKTWICSRLGLWWLFSYPGDSIVLTTAPTWIQVENLLWREMRSGYEKSVVRLGGRMLTTKYDLGPKWYAIGISTDESVNLTGFHATNILIIADEADGLPDETWNALESLTTSGNAKILAIGNPLNPASRFKKMSAAARAPKAKAIKISAWDVLPYSSKHPFLLQQSWVDDKRSKWGVGSSLWMGKIEAEWPDQGVDTLIPMAWLIAAKDHRVKRLERMLGVDVARFGTNRTVRTLMEGGWMAHSWASKREDTMATAGRIFADIREYGVVAVAIDETGVGGGVVDRLRQLSKTIPIVGVNNGAKPWDDERFVNRGSEMYWRVRTAFERGEIGFSMEDPDAVDELINDLNRARYDTDEKGRIKVDKFGVGRGHTERSLSDESLAEKSPDRGDSLVLGFNAAAPYIDVGSEPVRRTFVKKRSLN